MRTSSLAVAALAGLLGAGCLVQIEHLRDPRPRFAEARREAARLQGRPGPARELNVLVYDAGEQKLVRVSVPMWLARKVGRRVEGGRDGGWADASDDPAGRAIRRHVDLREIEKAGLGILVEVEDDDGEQVLVWLR